MELKIQRLLVGFAGAGNLQGSRKAVLPLKSQERHATSFPPLRCELASLSLFILCRR